MTTYGIDANVLTRGKRTGTERYVSSLLKYMQQVPLQDEEEVVLYVSSPVDELQSLPTGWRQEVLRWPPKRVWTHGRLSLELRLRTPDVFFSPAHEIPLFAPRTQIVATVHDIAFRVKPRLYSSMNKRRQDWSVKRQIKKSRKLLTVSESTKSDLMRFYEVPPHQIVATPLSVDGARFTIQPSDLERVAQTYDLVGKKYVIAVGRVEKKKNIEFLISVFEDVTSEKPDVHLVLAGSYGYGEKEIRRRIEGSVVRNRIHVLGYVPDADLPALMKSAYAYVFPTAYEGFGIPALEAMHVGVPVIASNIPALKEVVGSAGLLASPEDRSEWVRAFRCLQKEGKRTACVEAGHQQKKQFTWEQTAKQTWQALREVANEV